MFVVVQEDKKKSRLDKHRTDTVQHCGLMFLCLSWHLACAIAVLYQLKHLFPGAKRMGIMKSYDDNLCLNGGCALITKNVRLPCSSDL